MKKVVIVKTRWHQYNVITLTDILCLQLVKKNHTLMLTKMNCDQTV